jgi:uncharacterized protein YmfQ (DUF2313 family)
MPTSTPPPPAVADHYVGMIERLLPPGPIWVLRAGMELRDIVSAIADECVRAHGRLLALLEEADPRTATEMLADWEAVCGLPDPAFGIPATVDARRALVCARWTAKGGQSAAYYIGIAAALGLTITITTPCQPFRAGGRAGAACYSIAWAYGWRVHAPNGPAVTFRAGGRAGYRLIDVRQPVLEALLSRYAPAHTIPVFEYHP